MFPLARYTVLESLRDKIYLGFVSALLLLNIVLVLMATAPWGMTNYSVERMGWMVVDVMLGLVSAIYAVNSIFREREKRILYSHLTLPLGRSGYIIGKSLGLFLSFLLLIIIGALITIGGDYLYTNLSTFPSHLLWMIPSIALKCAVVLGFAVLFSQLSSSALTATLFTLGIYVIGNGATEILMLSSAMTGTAKWLVESVYYLVPNLQWLDLEENAIYGQVTSAQLLRAIPYGFGYLTVTLTLACLVFQRKDL